jgi:hypothetical protein
MSSRPPTHPPFHPPPQAGPHPELCQGCPGLPATPGARRCRLAGVSPAGQGHHGHDLRHGTQLQQHSRHSSSRPGRGCQWQQREQQGSCAVGPAAAACGCTAGEGLGLTSCLHMHGLWDMSRERGWHTSLFLFPVFSIISRACAFRLTSCRWCWETKYLVMGARLPHTHTHVD